MAASNPKPRPWQWLRKYRIWEANRKDFLYPENSVVPEPAEGDAKRDETVRRRPEDSG
jgi:hypothetical protein